MKRCNGCNTISEDDKRFCQNCGGSVFIPVVEQANNAQPQQNYTNPNTQYSQQNYNNPNMQYNQQGGFNQNMGPNPPMATPPKKKSKLPIIIAIVVVVLIVFYAIGKNSGDAPENSGFESNAASDILSNIGGDNVPYSKGEVKDKVYSNEWADLRFEMPESWAEATQDAYASYEDEYTTCGFYGIDLNYNLLAVVFIDPDWAANLLSEETYIDEFIKGVRSSSNIKTTSEKSKVTVAGNQYTKVDVVIEQYGAEVCISIYTRKYDGRIISIVATSDSAENNDKNVAMLQPYSK